MNIYKQKQLWKIYLLVFASLIIVALLWYTNNLVKQVATEEQRNVKLWAQAVQRKIKLLKYTSDLFDKLEFQERKKVELWADATRELSKDLFDYSFIIKVVSDNTTVPVILTDENKTPIASRNLDPKNQNDIAYLKKEILLMQQQQNPIEIVVYGNKKNYLFYKNSKIFSELKVVLNDIVQTFITEVAINSASVPVIFADSRANIIATGNIDSLKIKDTVLLKQLMFEMKNQNQPIEVDFMDNKKHYIYYSNSSLLTSLKYYPFIMLAFMGAFLLVAYVLFSTARKAEQNQVWVGMAKETAHQLGTPLSSLMAWVEYLKTKNVDNISDLEKDINRLEIITNRFSNIGSIPKLKSTDLQITLEQACNYVKQRSPKTVEFKFLKNNSNITLNINAQLFEWAIENICRNAIDAMNGKGIITINLHQNDKDVFIDISDTGKGIEKSKIKTIFEPGYTTKERGWGLGLSLTKRIIESYHHGKIYVLNSVLNSGTTFRIQLRK